MTGYLVSLLMGLAVGVAYGLMHVRSPAPLLIALVGLLGMALGEQAIDAVRHQFVSPPAHQAGKRSATRAQGHPPGSCPEFGRN